MANWKLSGDLLYRLVTGDVQESQVIVASSGNGTIMDGGDGIGKLQEDSPQAVLTKLSGFPVDANAQSMLFWVYAQRDPSTSALVSAPIWFDMDHYLRMSHFTFGLDSPTVPGAGILYGWVVGQGTNAVTMTSTDGRSRLVLNPSTAHLEIALQEGGTLSLDFNNTGQVCAGTSCASQFFPVNEVQAPNGASYIIDVRGLFTVSPETTNYPEIRNPANSGVTNQTWQSFWQTTFEKGLRVVRFIYRKQRAADNRQQPMTIQQGQPIEVDWTF